MLDQGGSPAYAGFCSPLNEGDVHLPRRDNPTRLIRIEGGNLENVRRLAYEAV